MSALMRRKKYWIKALCLLSTLLLTVQMSLASKYKDNIDEYKAPSGGWKIIVKQDKVNRRTGDSSIVTAISPERKQIHVGDGIRNAEVKWINGETAEIIDKCGLASECRHVYFYDIHKGLSRIFLDAVAYSIQDNLIACPSYNYKKKRIELVVSEIYPNKKEPVAVIYRKWSDQWTDWVVMFLAEHSVNKGFFIGEGKIHLEYVEKESGEIKKEDISFDKEPPFVVCGDSSKDGGEIEYCSIAEDDYKKGYIWFAAEQPPVGMIDTPKESPLCYRFPSFGLDGQLKKLKDKYGADLYDEKITKEPDGSSSLSAKRKDESGKEIVYAYFDNPMSCAEYQTKRLGEAPPVPYYDYGGCVGECCGYNTWTAKEKVALRKDHSDLSPVVTTIEANEKIDALTGVVITKQLGKIKVLKSISTNKKIDCGVPFEKGDNIYTLHYLGEGDSLIWHNGQLYDCTVFLEEKEHLSEIEKEKSEWWAKIATKDGKTGWTREIEKFSDVYCTE